jgi:hypothetical protein
MDIKNMMIGALVGLVVLFGGFWLTKTTQIIAPTPKVGALTGPILPYNYFGFGNMVFYGGAPVTLTQNASTTCSIQGPAATSTIQAAQIRFDVSSSSATIVEIGVASDPNSTTTLLGTTYNIAANASAFIQASTSPAAGAKTVIGPNQYVNFKVGGGALGNLPTGTCQVEFLSS